MADDGDTMVHAQPQLVLAVELVPSVEAAAQARALVSDVLLRGGHSELSDTACLLTSELVANAVLHAGAPVELVVDLDPTRLAVEVFDPSTADPVPSEAGPHDTCGRGLAMVEELADEWGVHRIRPGFGPTGRDASGSTAPAPPARDRAGRDTDEDTDSPGKSVWFCLSA